MWVAAAAAVEVGGGGENFLPFSLAISHVRSLPVRLKTKKGSRSVSLVAGMFLAVLLINRAADGLGAVGIVGGLVLVLVLVLPLLPRLLLGVLQR